MKEVYIEWNDAFSLDNWQQKEVALLSSAKPMLCKTIGFLMSKNKDTVVICHTINAENQVCGVIQIPARCINKLIYL